MAAADTNKLVSLERQKAALKAFREAGDKGLTRKKLATAIGCVSLRTPDRTLDVLRKAGAKFEEKTDGKTREKVFVMTKGPKWDETISKETRLALRVAAMALGHGGNATLEKQLETLEQIADKSLTDKDRKFFDRLRANIRVTGGVAEKAGDGQLAILDKIFTAFAAEIPRQVEVEYTKAGATSPRTIVFSPYCLTQDLISGGTFILGEEVAKREIKQLRVSRIKSLKVLDRPVIHLRTNELERAAMHQIGGWAQIDTPFEVKLRVKGASWIQAMEEARPDFPGFTIDRKAGFAIATFQANAPEGLIRWILQMGPSAEVLEPESLRRDVAKAVDEMASLYR